MVRFNCHFEWNDIINPNLKYLTDRLKSAAAAILSLGHILTIGSQAACSVAFCADGSLGAFKGYPGD